MYHEYAAAASVHLQLIFASILGDGREVCLRLVLVLLSSVMRVSVSVLSLSSRSWSRSTAASRSLHTFNIVQLTNHFFTMEDGLSLPYVRYMSK
jgi:hypothetical protein